MTTPNQPGWYDDAGDPNALRYWDGQDWTPLRQPKPPLPTARASTVVRPPRLPPPPNLPPPSTAAPTLDAPPPPPDDSAVPAGWYPDPTGKSDDAYWDGRQWDQHPPSIAGAEFFAPLHETQPPAGAELAPVPETQPAVGHAQQRPGNYAYKNPVLYGFGGLFLPPLVLFLMGGSRATCAWMMGLWVLFWLTVWVFFVGFIFLPPLYIWSAVACYRDAVRQNQTHGFAS
jgi:hypothetical protein